MPTPKHPHTLRFPGRRSLTLDAPRIMGILNATPDSFSDGGQFVDVEQALAAARAMVDQGAAVLDIGGESTRPGARRVSAEEQIQRVVPVIQRIRGELPEVVISIDTTLAEVAQAAADAGAGMVNDVSAGREDPAMFALAADRGLPIVLMHMRGAPATMQDAPRYEDVVAEVRAFLLERAQAAHEAGVARGQVVLDPGIGFGKTLEHNLALLANLRELVATGYPILLGASRKGLIAKVTQPERREGEGGSLKPGAGEVGPIRHPRSAPREDCPPDQRLGGTVALTALAVAAGVHLLRVHDVWDNRQAAQVARAVGEAGR